MVKKILKDEFYFILYIWRSILKPLFKFKEIAVLMYHSVEANDWPLSVDPAVFDRQMKYLKNKNYCVISLADIVDYLEGGRQLANKTIAITFDDGYLDNYLNAYPILKKYNLPATIFTATKDDRSIGCASPYPLFNWLQAKEMSSGGLISIESHSHSHPNLKLLPPDELEQEIGRSVEKIKSQLNYQSRIFAYPGGRFSQQVIDCLKMHGFKAGFSTNEGLIRKNDNMFKLTRISVHRSVTFFAFKVRLTKAIDWYATILRWLRIRGIVS